MGVTFSRRLAFVGGVLLPALETARRWREIPGPIGTWHHWLDDYMLGAILLFGAWRCTVDAAHGRKWLIAAWAFCCGFGVQNVIIQWERVNEPIVDPSGLSQSTMLLIRSALVAIAVIGLWSSMRGGGPSSRSTTSLAFLSRPR